MPGCRGLAPAGYEEPRGCSLTPGPWWDREENWKKMAKHVGWDKESLTEQQRNREVTTIIPI